MQQTTNPVPGTIGAFAESKIKTRTGLLARMLENKHRLDTKWRGTARPGGGYAADVTPPMVWRGTTKQTCGLYPFPLGNTCPKVGAPVGTHYDSGEALGCDPLSWFLADMIQNPSVAFMSNPAAGKSTAMRVMMEGLIAHGVVNLVIGDQKDEHGAFMEHHGGKRARVAPGGRGTINVLDPANVYAAIKRVEQEFGLHDERRAKFVDALLTDMHMRRTDGVCALVSIHRAAPVTGVEETVIDAALRYMHEMSPDRVPILEDLLKLINNPPTSVKEVTNWRGDEQRYIDRTDQLVTDLSAVCYSGTFGAMFNGPTSVEIDYSKGLVFDISGIDANQPKLVSAAYLATWAVAFGIINTAHVLADAGLEPRRQFMVWLDEFWQPLAASKGMVDRTNRMTRLNRTIGTGMAYAFHTLDDLEALPDEEDRRKARGIIRRCGMQWFGGLPFEEVEKISEKVTRLREAEMEQLVAWYNPAFEEQTGDIPGRGCFLIKRAELPGIPVRVVLTQKEIDLGLHDTSKRLTDYDHAA